MERSFRSKLEEDCFEILEELFPNVVIEHDYHIGHGLKLDFYIRSSVPVAVEVDGPQHTSYNMRFHADMSDFQDQVRRDRRKESVCRELGIPVVRIDGRRELKKDLIHTKILAAIREFEDSLDEGTPSAAKRKSEYRNHCKERARDRRKEQYRWYKDMKNGG